MTIWGWKTVALFDVWSLEHFIGGITVGAFVIYFFGKKLEKNRTAYLLIVAGLAYFWEFIEYNLEIGDSGMAAVTYWFQGVEYWGNRLITDPVLGLAGALLALKYKKFIKPARIASIAWYMIHVFIFPHCMYLHTLFAFF